MGERYLPFGKRAHKHLSKLVLNYKGPGHGQYREGRRRKTLAAVLGSVCASALGYIAAGLNLLESPSTYSWFYPIVKRAGALGIFFVEHGCLGLWSVLEFFERIGAWVAKKVFRPGVLMIAEALGYLQDKFLSPVLDPAGVPIPNARYDAAVAGATNGLDAMDGFFTDVCSEARKFVAGMLILVMKGIPFVLLLPIYIPARIFSAAVFAFNNPSAVLFLKEGEQAVDEPKATNIAVSHDGDVFGAVGNAIHAIGSTIEVVCTRCISIIFGLVPLFKLLLSTVVLTATVAWYACVLVVAIVTNILSMIPFQIWPSVLVVRVGDTVQACASAVWDYVKQNMAMLGTPLPAPRKGLGGGNINLLLSTLSQLGAIWLQLAGISAGLTLFAIFNFIGSVVAKLTVARVYDIVLVGGSFLYGALAAKYFMPEYGVTHLALSRGSVLWSFGDLRNRPVETFVFLSASLGAVLCCWFLLQRKEKPKTLHEAVRMAEIKQKNVLWIGSRAVFGLFVLVVLGRACDVFFGGPGHLKTTLPKLLVWVPVATTFGSIIDQAVCNRLWLGQNITEVAVSVLVLLCIQSVNPATTALLTLAALSLLSLAFGATLVPEKKSIKCTAMQGRVFLGLKVAMCALIFYAAHVHFVEDLSRLFVYLGTIVRALASLASALVTADLVEAARSAAAKVSSWVSTS